MYVYIYSRGKTVRLYTGLNNSMIRSVIFRQENISLQLHMYQKRYVIKNCDSFKYSDYVTLCNAQMDRII